jgi:hypothetical protein
MRQLRILITILGRVMRRISVAILRPLAVVCLLVATLALASDMTRTSGAGGLGIAMTPVAVHWKSLSPQSLANVQASVQRASHPLVWSAAIAPLLQTPSWLLFGVLGVAAAVTSRRRRVVNVYAN